MDVKNINLILQYYKEIFYHVEDVHKLPTELRDVILVDSSKINPYYMGEVGVETKIFKLPFEDEYYLKIELTTDSYGTNEFFSNVKLVKPITKNTLTFE